MMGKSNKTKTDNSLTILITGGSSGIGYQAVLKLISFGNFIKFHFHEIPDESFCYNLAR